MLVTAIPAGPAPTTMMMCPEEVLMRRERPFGLREKRADGSTQDRELSKHLGGLGK
jgi:hypothetical protein